jgi:DNA primase
MDDVAQVREKIDIVSLLSEYIPLKKIGRNFTTNCPFHNEKTPSFVVSPERQIWHCFGCGKGGDAFTFLMEYENMEFPESLRLLAKKVGVQLSAYTGQSGVSSKKEEIYKINKLAQDFYHYILLHHPVGKKALLYLTKERNLNEAVIKTFQLGYAPKKGDALVSYLLTKKKYKKEDVLDAGLTSQRYGRVSDFFVDRLIFPLLDHRENVIGFSGRILEGSSQMGKYINTRETLVYHKGEVFFGLHIAKNEIKKEANALVMEGEFDVISAFQQGFTNAVAIKGTALTEQQVSLLSRFTPKVSLCFDQDSAGQQALLRSLPSIEKKGLTAVVVKSADGKDPDESIRANPYGFKHAIKHAEGIYDYIIDETIKKYGTGSEGKKQISDIILPLLQHIENEIVKDHYIRLLASRLDTSSESIQKQLEKIVRKEISPQMLSKKVDKKSREEMLEEYLLSLIIQSPSPKKAVEASVAILQTFMPKERAYQKILSHVVSHVRGHEQFDGTQFIHTLPEELTKTYDTCFLYPLPKFADESLYIKEVEKVAGELKMQYIRSSMKQLSERLKTKEKKDEKTDQEDEELVTLQEEFSKLSTKLHT